MIKCAKFSFIILVFNFYPVVSAYSQDTFKLLNIYYNERPPYFYTDKDGNAQGIVIDRVKAAFIEANVPYKFGVFPAKRILNMLKVNKERFCTVGWYKNEERQKFTKFSDYIYQNKSRIALASADNDKIQSGKTLDEILSNKKLILLIKDGFSYGKFIDNKIIELKPVMQKVTFKNTHIIKMILMRRADYFFTSEEESNYLIPELGFKKEDFKYIKFSNMPTGLKRYIMYSRKVEDNLIKKVDAAITKYK